MCVEDVNLRGYALSEAMALEYALTPTWSLLLDLERKGGIQSELSSKFDLKEEFNKGLIV